MNILFLTVSSDVTSNILCKWLINKNVKFSRLNLDISYEKLMISIENDKCEIVIGNIEVTSPKYTHVIYRRGEFKFKRLDIDNEYYKQIVKNLNAEENAISEFIFHVLRSKPNFGSYFKERYQNKLLSLLHANQSGFKIPISLITTDNLSKVKEYFGQKNVVSKPVYNSFIIESKGRISHSYTTKVEFNNFLNKTSFKGSDYRFPTYYQEGIEVQFEIRIFYFLDIIEAAYIWTEKSGDYDYRINKNKINIGPYELPEKIIQCVKKFIEISKIETGSIDLLYTTKGEYVFLEVNPLGQFSNVSYFTNLNLEKKIIEKLCLI